MRPPGVKGSCGVNACVGVPSSSAGTPALTSRGFVEEDFGKVAEFFDRAVKLTVDIKKSTGKAEEP